ncbi:hypothetical protein PV11_06733 [Exophiala sideris]|uniref:Uncharacterized protein n=1 Tax=Exophiala sideris TaxID=1016849 RepID=A0A0D1VST5_9EURO|nr:hypothetical protein PV11_06733 [Exophiala sideris]
MPYTTVKEHTTVKEQSCLPGSSYCNSSDNGPTNPVSLKQFEATIVPVPSITITPKHQANTYRDTIIDIAALTITFALMAGMIALGVYVWRRRCREGACDVCLARHRRNASSHDDDMEDNGLVWEPKAVAGKRD